MRRRVAEEGPGEHSDHQQVSVGELAKQYTVSEREPDPRHAEQREGDRARRVGLSGPSQRERRGEGRQEDRHHRRHPAVERGRRQCRRGQNAGQPHGGARSGEPVELERRAGRQERQREREREPALEDDQHRRHRGRGGD